jgi:hypothetical protein
MSCAVLKRRNKLPQGNTLCAKRRQTERRAKRQTVPNYDQPQRGETNQHRVKPCAAARRRNKLPQGKTLCGLHAIQFNEVIRLLFLLYPSATEVVLLLKLGGNEVFCT